MTELIATKLDILSGIPELPVCVGYRHNGQMLRDFPQDTEILAACEPVYETLPGWSEDISGIRDYDRLPAATHAYLDRIRLFTGVPVSIVSVGPEREQLMRNR
jgi:adenylosuccinate synthase